MSPPQQLRQQTSNCSSLLIYRPRKDERLSWPSWLTYSRWLTHINGHPSATSRAQDSESTSAKDQCSTAGPRNQPTVASLPSGTRAVRDSQVSRFCFSSVGGPKLLPVFSGREHSSRTRVVCTVLQLATCHILPRATRMHSAVYAMPRSPAFVRKSQIPLRYPVADRFEAGRRVRTCSEQKSGLLSSTSCRSATSFEPVCDQIA